LVESGSGKSGIDTAGMYDMENSDQTSAVQYIVKEMYEQRNE